MPFDSLDLRRDEVFPRMALEPTLFVQRLNLHLAVPSQSPLGVSHHTISISTFQVWHPSHNCVLFASFLSPHLLTPRTGKF